MYGPVELGIIVGATVGAINLTIYGLARLSESGIAIQLYEYRTAMRQHKKGELDKRPTFADFRLKKNSIPTPSGSI